MREAPPFDHAKADAYIQALRDGLCPEDALARSGLDPGTRDAWIGYADFRSVAITKLLEEDESPESKAGEKFLRDIGLAIAANLARLEEEKSAGAGT